MLVTPRYFKRRQKTSPGRKYPASAVVLNGFLLCLSTRCNLVKHLSYAE